MLIVDGVALAQMRAAPADFARATRPISLDGRLDEASWEEATPLTHFVETYPEDLGAAPVQTEARFLYDDKNIYIGIRASDSNSKAIRSSLVRRDFVLADQDYLEVLLDPQNTRRSATFFRVNPSGVQTDGIFSEDAQLRDYAPDFNFDVATSRTDSGWTAEFRIPLATLHYRTGSDQNWAFVIVRNLPRETAVTLTSAPISRDSACTLCFAGKLGGITLRKASPPLFVTPQVTYSHLDDSQKARVGLDFVWQPRSDIRVDTTINPDFAQVEADDLQLTANTRFALAVPEKRPFFLDSADLLATPVTAVYTRAFANPEVGTRISRRGDSDEYTALFLQDAGGGSILEPGPRSSEAGPENFTSNALVGRYRHSGATAMTWGLLGSGRWYSDGSRNFVVGTDANWSPSVTDRISAQVLWSETQEPNRPTDLTAWQGQAIAGDAGAFTWSHTGERWFTILNYYTYSRDFRSWNGFVPQVGVSEPGVTSGLYFYPNNRWLIRVAPQVAYSEVDERGGQTLSRSIGPGISFNAARDTTFSLFWYPRAMDTSFAGSRTYNMYSVSLLTTPFSWMPQVSVSGIFGSGIDFSTGKVVAAQSWQLSLPLRLFGRLELAPSIGYETLDSRDRAAGRPRLLQQQNAQLSAIWHFSGRFYVRALYQRSQLFQHAEEREAPLIDMNTERASFLASYQVNWQTRLFVGANRTDDDRELFAKLSYVFSPASN